jgi:hypothetical protein
MTRTSCLRAFIVTVLLVPCIIQAAALEARVAEIRIVGPTVRASVELRQSLPDKLKQVVQAGGSLHVRLQTEMWEDRAIWDKIVRPASITVYRIARDPVTSQIAVSSPYGRTAYPDLPERLQLRVDVIPADAVSDDGHYYLRMIVTVGTIAEREIQNAGDAVFGQDESTVSLGTVGKFIFNTVLQATDYLQSVSAEARSRRFEGRELRPGIK